MRKSFTIVFAMIVLLSGCGRENFSYWEQPVPQADFPQDTAVSDESVRAVWIPVMQYAAWMTGQTEAAFRCSVQTAFTNCSGLGLNTVFLHVRAYQDAYYDSALFPKGAYLTGDYDPLAIMTEEAHNAGLSVHAWINPLRGQTPEGLAGTDSAYILRQWYDDDSKNGTYLVNVDGRYWLNPAYAEVRQLCADGVTEILEHYDVDGIHIDDYFYPTQAPDFDADAFAASGESDLGAFRRENCTQLVQTLYSTVKSYDPACIFSISPQGNQRINFDELYADTALWAETPGCCDWLLPQLYYGFENDTCPFAETLDAWEQMTTAAKLIPGLASYKIGKTDAWAGSGADEWQTDPEVLSAETALVLEETAGVAYYSYASLFEPDPESAAWAADERERIRALLSE